MIPENRPVNMLYIVKSRLSYGLSSIIYKKKKFRKIIITQIELCMVHILVLFQAVIPLHLRNTVNSKGNHVLYKIFSLRDICIADSLFLS